MKAKVPQFIDIEDKIVGPLTLKQFLYFLAGGILIFILWFIVKLGAFIVIVIPIVIICLALAFYHPQGQPLIKTVKNMFYFFIKPKLYTWKKNK